MKKTFNINVAGYPFTIDDDAYELLNNYLDTIGHAFSSQDDSNEIVADIEARVAELLTERSLDGRHIITVADIETVIERVGQPEDFISVEETVSGSDGDNIDIKGKASYGPATPPPYTPPLPPVKKKLFRDPQNQMLGGVCSGLAHYLNIDPTVMRLLTVLLTVLSLSTIALAYLILWIVIPEARTPLQRMEMLGETPTMENIGKTVTDNFREDNGISVPASDNSLGGTLANIFGVIAKALVIIGLVIGIPILIALVIALVACLFTLIVFGSSAGFGLFSDTVPEWIAESGAIPVYGLLCGIGCILVIAIPIFFLVWMGLHRQVSKGVRNTLLVIWVIGLIAGAVSAGKIVSMADEYDNVGIHFKSDETEFNNLDLDGWTYEDSTINGIPGPEASETEPTDSQADETASDSIS